MLEEMLKALAARNGGSVDISAAELEAAADIELKIQVYPDGTHVARIVF